MKIDATTFAKLPEHLQALFDKAPNPGRDEVRATFPQAKGQQGDPTGHTKPRGNGIYGDMAPARDALARIESDTSAARFFYAANAEIMLFAWALDEQPAQVWDLTTDGPMPFDLESALLDPEVVVYAHNSMFDRTVMRYAMPDLCPPIERWRDTMVQALCHSLPGALGALCQVLGVPSDKAKDKDGKRLIQLFCKPRPKTSKMLRATRDTHPADWAKFVAYAGDDIEAMREVERRLPKWNYRGDELALWHLDQTINDRGVAIDIELANAALAAVDAEQVVLAARTAEMTNGEVQTATQRDAMLQHMLAEYGVQLPDMQSADVRSCHRSSAWRAATIRRCASTPFPCACLSPLWKRAPSPAPPSASTWPPRPPAGAWPTWSSNWAWRCSRAATAAPSRPPPPMRCSTWRAAC